MERKVFNRPPIKEAVLEILFNYLPETKIEDIESFGNVLLPDFPEKGQILQIQGQIIKGNTNITPVSQSIFGYTYLDRSKNRMIQTRLNGFSFILLNQTYTKWDDFKAEAYNWLFKFIDFIQPASSPRFSLRFLNQFDIFTPVQDLSEYLKIAPGIGIDVDGNLNSLFMRMEIPSSKYNSLAIITETMNPMGIQGHSLFFDIDVIKLAPIGLPFSIDLSIIEKEFDILREFKNDIFFNSLTQKTTELFN